MSIRAIIIDDEPLARSRIKNLLQHHTDVVLVGECRSGGQAVASINERKPDLIFLDVRMADIDGFKVLTSLSREYMPLVVIVSAYDQYALKAFDIDAVDYLQKPYDEERFNQALQRVRARIEMNKTSVFQKRMVRLMNEFAHGNDNYLNTITLKERGHTKHIQVDDIFYFESYGNYLKLHLESGFKLYRCTMQWMELRLNPRQFLRVHRYLIVNVFMVRETRYLNNNEFLFLLRNGQELNSSRSYKERISEFMEYGV